MKTKLFTLITCLIFISIYGQTNHIINDNAIDVHNVCAVDIDGDGDLDVLSASFTDNTVAWYENINEQGIYWWKHIITDQIGAPHHVCPADFDGDGDMDVVYAGYLESKIAWGENDGLGNFTEHIITAKANGVHEVFLADFNGDGYIDVISAMVDGKTLVWYENDGLGNFVDHIIPAGDEHFGTIYVADLDGDRDMDVLSGSGVIDPFTDKGKVVWYENTNGLGTFHAHSAISSSPNNVWAVSASDLDGDGDQDLLASIDGGTKLVCYENTNGLGNFVEVIQILTPNYLMWIQPIDFDNDGDMDLLCAEYGGLGFITLFRNDGDFNFTKFWIISGAEGAMSAFAADINNDGYLDVVSGWSEANKIVWTEDFRLSVEENLLSDFSVYPNPTTDILTIQSDFAILQIEIYNQLGQIVVSNSNQKTIDISSLTQGIYFCKIKDGNGNVGTQKVVKN